ncbi:MAG: M3 family metallopeptidase [Xanthomonadales bacterium]|nr:M3 family metallopeptidase [Xanthomonadales bacterium]
MRETRSVKPNDQSAHNKLTLPDFESITATTIVADVECLLEAYQQCLDSLENIAADELSWKSLVMPELAISLELDEYWSPVSHLNHVADNEKLRDAYDKAREKITAFFASRGQNHKLYQRWQQLMDSSAFQQLDAVQQRIIEHELRDFKLSGVALEGKTGQRFRELVEKKSQLSSDFSNNLLDATKLWRKLISDKDQLAGLPENELCLLQGLAEVAEEASGSYLLNLSYPAYIAVMTYADDTGLREEMYRAFSTRASENMEITGSEKYDNNQILLDILSVREEMAALLGFSDYAEYALETRMADSSAEVMAFLQQLAKQATPAARVQFEELQAFVLAAGGPQQLQAWDIGYWSEKLRQQRYSISEQQIRPYFPAPAAVEGLFSIVEQLYGISFRLDATVSSWHSEVEYYRVYSAEGKEMAGLYLDLYARDDKRSGAWMDVCRSRHQLEDEKLQLPVAFLTCNFAPPQGDTPSLLSHSDVETLFHECGHCLHHLLTRIDWPQVGGINGVEWDAVELPSQILENWCWEKSALDRFARHYQTGEALPEELLVRMTKARHFQKAMQLVRQLEFAITDMRLHLEFDSQSPLDPNQLMAEVHNQVGVTPMPEYNRMLCSFGHLFAGGYAAGYYSYLWAELLSEDAFSRFLEEGIFNPETGAAFRDEVLAVGASRPAAESFAAFRGRAPRIAPLLAAYGIGENQ